MRTKTAISVILLMMVMAISFTSCKKDKAVTTVKPSDATWVSDDGQAQNIFDNVKVWSDQAMQQSKSKATLSDTIWMGTCVLATLDLSAVPYVLTIDFGASNCLCLDQIYRRGKIFVSFNGSYWATGTVIAYTFENYFVNDHQVLGTKTVTNLGRNAADHLNWSIVVDGQIIKPNNGGTITWISSHNLEWIEGEGTIGIWWDDTYRMTGTTSGVSSDNKTYSATIETPLERTLNCQWIQKGVINFVVQDLPLIVLDYGAGTCEDTATVTISGLTYTIHM